MLLAFLVWLIANISVGICGAGKLNSNVQHPSGPGILLPDKISNYDFGTNKYNFSLDKNTEISGTVLAVADLSGDGTHDLVVLKDSTLYFYLGSKTNSSFTKSAVSVPCKDECIYAHFGHFAGDPYNNPLNLLVTERTTSIGGSEIFKHYFWYVMIRPKSKGKKNEFEVFAVEKAQTKPLISHSLLLLVDFYSNMKISFVGADESNRLTVWSFSSEDVRADWNVLNLPSDCKLSPYHQSHYVDLNGDKFPDLVFVCSSESSNNAYLEYWMNEPASTKSPQRHFVLHKQYSPESNERLPVRDTLIKDATSIKIFDVFGTGLNHLLVGTNGGKLIVYPNKIPFCTPKNDSKCFYFKGIGDVAIVQEESVTYGFNTSLSNPKILSIGNENSIAKIQFADINLDGYLDLVLLLGNGRLKFVVFDLNSHFYSLLESPSLAEAYSLTQIRAASFIHIGLNQSIDILLNVFDSVDNARKVYFLANKSSFDSFFVRVYPMDVPFENIKYGRFSPPLPGSAVYFTVQLGKHDSYDGSHQGMRQISFNFWSSTTDPLSSLPSITFGLGRMNNFLPFITITSTSGQLPAGENSKTWNSIIPNSKLMAYVPSKRNQLWHLLIYFNKSTYMVTVTIVVTCTIGTFGFIALICKLREMNEDKKERKKSVLLINFNAL